MKPIQYVAVVVLLLGLHATAGAHERREVGGMQVVFGGEPEPVLDGEICNLRWRFSDLESEEPVPDLEEVQVLIQFDGNQFGPFDARASRRDPGMYQTQHIFTKPGQGTATLTFRKSSEGEELQLRLPFRVRSRKTLEIP